MSALSVVEAHQVLDEIERQHPGLAYRWPDEQNLAILTWHALPTLVREWRAQLARHQMTDSDGHLSPEIYYCAACRHSDWPCPEVTSVLAYLEPFRGLLGGDV